MLTLLKNIECYCPEYKGPRDILLSNDKIMMICPAGQIDEKNKLISKVITCDGLQAFPGLIDQHVHITGGGGEWGFSSRIPEISPEDISEAGVTTLVGTLGFDSYTKNLESLLAKANSLESQGFTTYIYTGSYQVPTITLTGSVARDIILIDKVIGVGEIALSDVRSSQPSPHELLKIFTEAYSAGLITQKAGVVHIHIGDSPTGLKALTNLVNQSDLPKSMFVPTHINRNTQLFKEGIEFCKSMGKIDLTAGEKEGLPIPDAIEQLMSENIDMKNVTVSSDANGSSPGGGISRISALYEDIVSCIFQKNVPVETAFRLVTENVAKTLKLYPRKGVLMEGSDADILITDKKLQVNKLISMGKILFEK